MHYAVHDDSEVNPVPTARRPLNRLPWPFVLTPPPVLGLPLLSVSRRLSGSTAARKGEGAPCCRIAGISSGYRLALVKAATRRRSQALTLEFDITAKRRNSEKKRERRAAESPASRQARLALVKAATRRRRQALTLMGSDITDKRRNSVKKRERRAAESPASR